MVYKVDVKHVTEFLKGVDIFRALSERHLDRVAAVCEELSFGADEDLSIQNEPESRIYIIRRGEVAVMSSSDEDSVLLRTLRERETFALAALFEPPIVATTARAVTDGQAYVIPRVRMLELCELEPRIGMHVYRAAAAILLGRYRHTLQWLSALASPEDYVGPLAEGSGF